jgi:hypothetical protein
MTVFIVIFVGAITTGSPENIGQGDRLESYDITQEDLSISPDLPDPNPTEIDLSGDLIDSSNINVTDPADVNNTDYKSDKVLKLRNESSQGWALYRFDGDSEFLTTKVTKFGFFESSTISLEEYQTADTQESPIDTTFLSRQQQFDMADQTNFIRIVLEPSDDYVYELTQQEEVEKGLLGTTLAWIQSAGTAISSWLTLFTGLPSQLIWLSIVFGIIGLFIVLEVILW